MATLTLSKTSGKAGDAVSMTYAGFNANESLRYRWYRSNGSQFYEETWIYPSRPTSFVVNASTPADAYKVEIAGLTSGQIASAPFTVTAAAASTTTPAPAPAHAQQTGQGVSLVTMTLNRSSAKDTTAGVPNTLTANVYDAQGKNLQGKEAQIINPDNGAIVGFGNSDINGQMTIGNIVLQSAGTVKYQAQARDAGGAWVKSAILTVTVAPAPSTPAPSPVPPTGSTSTSTTSGSSSTQQQTSTDPLQTYTISKAGETKTVQMTASSAAQLQSQGWTVTQGDATTSTIKQAATSLENWVTANIVPLSVAAIALVLLAVFLLTKGGRKVLGKIGAPIAK